MSEAGFSESTIAAAVWLACFQPDRLPQFLREHPPGHVLQKVAKARIEAARRKRAEASA